MSSEKETFTGVRIPYSDLSGTLDPHKVYETRAKYEAVNASSGLERFAYRVFGPAFIGSLAFAMNPYVRYEFPTMRITPVNRVRKPITIDRKSRQATSRSTTIHCANAPNTETVELSDFGPVSCTTSTSINGPNALIAQPAVRGFIGDTTVRTRSLNSKGGEFELFIPRMSSPGHYNTGHSSSKIIVFPEGGDHMQYDSTVTESRTWIDGPDMSYPEVEANKILIFEKSMFTQTVAKYGLGVLADSLPTSRRFSAVRSLVELRETPMLLRNSLEALIQSSTLLGLKGQGKQYLNVVFGWAPLYQDILDLLALPEVISKEINRLIDRRGQPTVFRAKRQGLGTVDTSINPHWDQFGNETWVDGSWTSSRKWSLKSAVTYTLRFPQIDVPRLREDLLSVKWGKDPRPQDVYNLVPWTWLVDWFSGLGQYVDLMNTLASDKSLFNYGYLTYTSEGQLSVSTRVRTSNGDSVTIIGPNSSSSTSYLKYFPVEGRFPYKYQRRVDISTLAGVKAISRPATLSVGQSAIIGALLTKFTSN